MRETKGELDTTTAHQLRDVVADVTRRHTHSPHLIADLSELAYADAEALSTLMSIRTPLREDQGELRLVCPEGRVVRILQGSKVARVMPLHATLAAALAAPRALSADRTGGAGQ
ncbi:STAS domain-containing protein [Streptomyces sp. CoH27]|uniref:STAS domain-containing protein n=1 Tax=Streptomyces sp. CoH27 TaxID=2875763 RepID=UPI001CD44EC7|nr:STAS domain-containing protein [Streptomyces sp. CoH27]